MHLLQPLKHVVPLPYFLEFVPFATDLSVWLRQSSTLSQVTLEIDFNNIFFKSQVLCHWFEVFLGLSLLFYFTVMHMMLLMKFMSTMDKHSRYQGI